MPEWKQSVVKVKPFWKERMLQNTCPHGFFIGDREIKLAKKNSRVNSLVVQWLGLGAFTAMAPGSIPGRGAKIPQVAGRGQKKKKFQEEL